MQQNVVTDQSQHCLLIEISLANTVRVKTRNTQNNQGTHRKLMIRMEKLTCCKGYYCIFRCSRMMALSSSAGSVFLCSKR